VTQLSLPRSQDRPAQQFTSAQLPSRATHAGPLVLPEELEPRVLEAPEEVEPPGALLPVELRVAPELLPPAELVEGEELTLAVELALPTLLELLPTVVDWLVADVLPPASVATCEPPQAAADAAIARSLK
jgi:hypothetical protein